MRYISALQVLTIYFSCAPFLLGEVFATFGFVLFVKTLPEPNAFVGLAFAAIGIIFIIRKIRTTKRGYNVMKFGLTSDAVITFISNTNLRHNKRVVKEYNFRYEVNGKNFNYEYSSAYKRHLRIGDKLLIFYLENNPKIAFIPALYNVRISRYE